MNKTEISKKLKKWFGNTFVVSFVSVWLAIAFENYLRNKEYGDIVRIIEQHQFNSSCEVNIDVRTEWPFGWSPSGMKISIEKEGEIVHTTTSKFFKADRIETSPGDFYYLYRWSEEEGNQLLASYMELEIERGSILKWIQIGSCEIPEGKVQSSYKYKKCEPFSQIKIRCT